MNQREQTGLHTKEKETTKRKRDGVCIMFGGR